MQNNNFKKKISDIILDTCILQYLGCKHLRRDIFLYLYQLTKRGFDLTFSNISIFEILCGATIKQEKEIFKTLEFYPRTFEISPPVLTTASQLSTLYCNEKIPNQQISVEDKIIAATSILSGSLIVTGDVNDFPRPFFIEAEIPHKIFFRHKNKEKMQVIYLLAPDYDFILKRFNDRK